MWFRPIYIKDIYDRRMRIQRPIILTDNNRMSGATFEMSQRNDHLYQAVRPLEAGRITFTDRGDYRNNLSRKQTQESTELYFFWDGLILITVFVLVIMCIVMTAVIGTQTAFNDVFLTQFSHDKYNTHQVDSIAYILQNAGHIKPLPYIIIAILSISSAVIVGWLSNPDLRLNTMWSMLVTFVLVILQVWGLIFHSILYDNVNDSKQIMLTINSVFWLHVVTIGITLFVVYYHSQLDAVIKKTDDTNHMETISTFWLTVAEDLNTIVCYVCVVSACNALGAVHDDTTIFFDVVCVVMIGFSQHIANVLMIFHAYIHSTTNKNTDTVVTVIARTRFFIFFIIGVVVVFFYLRIAPTYEEFTLGIPYEMFRVLAIVIMVSVSTLHSICYELQHASNLGKPWESSPAWKLMTISFIAFIFSAYILRNLTLDNKADLKEYLNNPITS